MTISGNVGFIRLDGDANRAWKSRQLQADQLYQAITRSDLLYPNPRGIYRARIFGDAPSDATMVELTLTAEKRVVINGHLIWSPILQDFRRADTASAPEP